MPSQPSIPRVAILNVVGLCPRLIGTDTPFLSAWKQSGGRTVSRIKPLLPAVTSSMQATFLTGRAPGDHGVVANYWYDRDFDEHRGWKQSNRLVQGQKVWETLREQFRHYTCAKVFWWNNLYSSADYSITPRPIYCADGKKVFDVQTWPMPLRDAIKTDLGDFPFPSFWGPGAGLPSSEWIANSARWFEERFSPNLNLVYLPHLDYNLQRLGPDGAIAEDLRQIDRLTGELVAFFESRGVVPIILSEYGITPVDRPIHINRALRKKGWITCRDELGREQIDPGNCSALAITDHQLAHVYVRDAHLSGPVLDTLRALPGVDQVYSRSQLADIGLDHPRSGDFVAVSDERSWFTYYFWEDDARAPDYARCVDIHRKPGYDPCELFLDPALKLPKMQIAMRLLKKKLGFRMLMDLIPLDASLVKGSHGCIPASEDDYPVLIGSFSSLKDGEVVAATDVHRHLLEKLSGR